MTEVFVVSSIAGDALSVWESRGDAVKECERWEGLSMRACVTPAPFHPEDRPARGSGRHAVVRDIKAVYS